MKVYTDIFTRDELFSDSFPMKVEYEGFIYNVSSKFMVKDEDEDILYDPDQFEKLENKPENTTKVDQIVDSFHLVEMTGIEKVKQLVDTVGPYLSTLRAKIEKESTEKLAKFNEQVKKFLADQVGKDIKNYKFYQGESNDMDKSMLIFQKFNDDGKTSQLFFFVDGLKEVKM
ncbi:hypothetical protein C9374_009305 [Naegleria lovaniensis]|uniref:TCTP domain-containing protein n=1 Tax=Naegleria lovaniensis TaxID=51637 RepID=A0AA88GDF3_NAELO|nr:uncharacterized protein C9374_009305 [Naegleria lovaniensis]KAG2377394.1 hypothetical protein C9374_009305 [Naegleria lovaniensis]